MLAELHLHLFGCIRALDLLRQLARRESVPWDVYEAGMEAAYGTVPPAWQVVRTVSPG